MVTSVSPGVADSQVLIRRMFDASPELLYRAWTQPESLVNWFAPNGCSIRYKQIDVRDGGTFQSCISTPDGYECWVVGEYRELVPPERIVFSMAIADADGRRRTAVEAGMDPDWPAESWVTVTFTRRGSQTELILTQTVSEALAKKTGAHPSWVQMLERLAGELTATSLS
jgi:uncharacterized protein YndB with AHSA1/START domain